MTQHFIEVDRLTRRFPQPGQQHPLTVFEYINFSIDRGQFVCVIGHSGCGKSTMLNILAGLDEATEGTFIMDGREVRGPGLDRGVMFQNHGLLPWLNVLGNLEFAVRARWPEWSRAEVRTHSMKYLNMLGLVGAEEKRPAQLTAGMRQRGGIARAFAIEPKLVLMDEPCGVLDTLTREAIQDELIRMWGRTHQTVLMSTHDVDEAILMADRVLLMTNSPDARIAEAVVIDIPRPRERKSIHEHPDYYAIRNHLVGFLINRAKELRGKVGGPGQPPVLVNPARSAANRSGVPMSDHTP